MSSMPRFVTKKKVTVTCRTPFRIGKIPYSGICRNIILSIEDISRCLENHAKVVEIFSNGKEFPLNFSNYDTYNGPTDVTDETEVLSDKPLTPEMEIKDASGKTIDVVNKKEPEEKKTVVRVTTNTQPKEEATVQEVNSDTKATVEVTAETKNDASSEVKAKADEEVDTKVEVENNSNNNKHNNNNNFKKNKFK